MFSCSNPKPASLSPWSPKSGQQSTRAWSVEQLYRRGRTNPRRMMMNVILVFLLVSIWSTHRGQCISSFAIDGADPYGSFYIFFFRNYDILSYPLFLPSQTEQSAEAVTFLTLIPEMRDPNLALGSEYSYCDSTWVSTVPPSNWLAYYPKLSHEIFLPSFQFINSYTSSHSTI
jgi:hypothetical protein